MAAVSQAQKRKLHAKLRRLCKRVDTKVVDAVFDEIFWQLDKLKSVSCILTNATGLCLQSRNELVAEVNLPRAKTVLRLMCARLAVRMSEAAKREVSPYDDLVESEMPRARFELRGAKLLCRVRFENTPDVQRIEIEYVPGPRRIPPRSKLAELGLGAKR